MQTLNDISGFTLKKNVFDNNSDKILTNWVTYDKQHVPKSGRQGFTGLLHTKNNKICNVGKTKNYSHIRFHKNK